MPKFKTKLRRAGERDVMGIDVPEKIVAELGPGKRHKVVVTLKGYSYRSTIAVMGGRYMLPLAKEHRAAGGIIDEETLEVTLTLDDKPREVAVPADLAKALRAEKLTAAFEKLAYTHRKEHVRAIEDAKKPETRAARIVKAVEMVRAKA